LDVGAPKNRAKNRAMTRLAHSRFDFAIFRRAAPHGVTQKPTPLINQGLPQDL
jgi:hypothetical protein